MNNNQNYQQQPQQGQQQPQQGQPNGQWQQPPQGQPNGQWQQPPQGQWQQPPQGFQQPYGGWQQPPKKGMSAGCIVGLIFGILFLIAVVIGGILIVMGAMVVNSVTQEFDDIGSEFYNTAFELYLGDNKPASSVYKLMASVRANNEDEDETNIIDVEIELNNGTVLNYNTYNSDLIPSTSTYYIEAEKNNKGYINRIEIEEL